MDFTSPHRVKIEPCLPMKILIVEDDPLMQLGLEQALGAHERFEIIGRVDNGYGAVQQAAVLNPDLIVMDIGLPGLDGIEATKQIKQTSPQIHIVVLTSHTLPNEIIAALSSGADAYCVKGATLERLILAIAAAQDASTFVYFDPPYRPLNKTSSFNSYGKANFNDNEQLRLAEYYQSLNNKNAKLMLSNSDPKNINSDDNFFDDLYRGFQIARIDALRMINSQADKRGAIKEILVVNYHR